MAVFSNLHHVGEVLATSIADAIPELTDKVRAAPPLESATSDGEEIRVSLLWVTPQASHRNDDWARKPGGGLTPPPLSLSAYYLITTYGTSEAGIPARAVELLGQVMVAFHTTPVLSLPSALAPDLGEGELGVVQVPVDTELTEKLYSIIQFKHRPWVLYEVGPISLPMAADDAAAQRVVAPGGLRFGDIEVIGRPQVLRVTPTSQVQGGQIRVDVDLLGRSLTSVRVDGVATPAASLTVIADAASYVLALPNAAPDIVAPGQRPVRVEVGDKDLDPPRQFSAPQPVLVLDPSTPTLDAPSAAVSLGAPLPLTLHGHNLGGATKLLCWPDAEITTPAQVVALDVGGVADQSLDLDALGDLVAGVWRVSARIGDHVYTPYVVLELTS